MSTNTKTGENQKYTATIEEIWNNLKVTDKKENQFQFSTCRDRHIVVLRSNKIKNSIITHIVRGDIYNCHYYQPRKVEQNTITYIMVYDDPSCNVCIINLIDIPPIEDFIEYLKMNTESPLLSPLIDIDKTIDKSASEIDLIIFICGTDDFELMKNMKKWASDRGYIMALVFVVPPTYNTEQRERFLLSIREDKKFIDNELNDFFEKGMFCISDLSSNDFQDSAEQTMAQDYVNEWRSKFLQVCVGNSNDRTYKIILPDERQSKKPNSCILS